MNDEEHLPQARTPAAPADAGETPIEKLEALGVRGILRKRMSVEKIAEKLNAEKVPTIHETNSWTAASVRKAFVS